MSLAPRALAQQPRTIYLVRHADKVSDAPAAVLNDAGHRRAERLAGMLADSGIRKIYTSDLKRTQQTAAPLAGKLHLKPVAIPLTRLEDLIQALQSENADSVLVVWHDATLPKILRALGAPEIPPIPRTEYDRFFILTSAAGKDHPDTRLTSLRYCDCAN